MSDVVEAPRLHRPVPLRPEDLVALLGPRAALELCRLAGGQRLPSISRFLRAARAQLIWVDYRRGYDLWTLGQKYRVSVRTVRRIVVARHKSDPSASTTG